MQGSLPGQLPSLPVANSLTRCRARPLPLSRCQAAQRTEVKGPKVDTASLPTAKPEVSTNGNGAISDHAQTHVAIRQPPLTQADHVAGNQDLEVDSVLAKELNDNGELLVHHLESQTAGPMLASVLGCVDSTGGQRYTFHPVHWVAWSVLLQSKMV